MGAPKPLLLWEGEPLIVRLARTLREGGASEVLVIVAPDATGNQVAAVLQTLPRVRTLVNPHPERGMLSSIQVGVQVAWDESASGFLVCPCDLPHLEPEDVGRVIEKGKEGTADAIVAPVFDGKRGHPTLFPRALIPEILALDSQVVGLNSVLKRFADRVVEIKAESEGVLRDVDTPDEWRRAKRV